MNLKEKRLECIRKLEEDVLFRRTGRSTGLAFKYLSEAYANPNQPIRIVDHYPSRQADVYLFDTIRTMCANLGFELIFDRIKLTITLEL